MGNAARGWGEEEKRRRRKTEVWVLSPEALCQVGLGGAAPGGLGQEEGACTSPMQCGRGCRHSIHGVSLPGEAAESVLQNGSFCVVRDGQEW